MNHIPFKYYYIVVLILFFLSCSQSTNDLGGFLKCQDYIYDVENKVYTNAYDYGCVYNPEEENTLGNISIYLTPNKTFYKEIVTKGEQLSIYEDDVNALTINDIKRFFDLKAFVIDKTFLEHTPELDVAYNLKDQYRTDLYEYDSLNNKWLITDSYTKNLSEPISEEATWRQQKITYPKLVENNDIHHRFLDSIRKISIDKDWYNEYHLWLSSYTPSYNYNYLVRVSEDSSFIEERSLKDLLIPYQKGDTLLLYHEKNLLESFIKDVSKPEVVIIRKDSLYYINSQLFDLENSISDTPKLEGFKVDEVHKKED